MSGGSALYTERTDERAEYVAGLRALADLIESHPELCVPSTGTGCSHWSVMPRTREDMQAWVAVLVDPVEKIADNFVSVRGKVGSLSVSAFGSASRFGRQITCERVTTEYEVESFLAAVAVQS